MHGTPKTIPLVRDNVVRPFLTTKKEELVSWCTRHEVEWCHDKSNDDTKYIRNYVRKNIVPHALEVNPGLHKVVARIVENKING
jgi:tRNA(Ile)-lysidine synthase